MDMINNNNTYNLIKNGLTASTTRSKMIANNMANVNTKGYKRFNVEFEENLKKEDKNLKLKKTNKRHFDGTKNDGIITIERDESTSMRTDGNNVDIDLEKIDQAANSLMYNALITSVNGKLNTMKYIISGGGK